MSLMLSEKAKSIKPGKYRHFKGGEMEVVGVGKHSETLEEYVIYKHTSEHDKFWIRPIEMFTGTVEINGEQHPRFQLIG